MMNPKSEFQMCIEAQRKYCSENHLPHFAPDDGYCDRCHQPIYSGRGYSLEKAGSVMISGCPHCRHSFCD